MRQFIKALIDGDTGILLQLLAKDAIHYSDGGGKVQAVPHPVAGAANVIKFYEALFRWFRAPDSRYSFRIALVNGSPGLILTIDGRVAYVYAFEAMGGRIRTIYAVANPDKLRHMGR